MGDRLRRSGSRLQKKKPATIKYTKQSKKGYPTELCEATEETEDNAMGKPRSDHSPSAGGSKEPVKERKPKPKKERWLLTRKTWRYMADAGRKLIPEGTLNRPEDIPKIEAYFQEICYKEPRFLLWRKQSYPGAIGFRSRGRSRGGRLKKGGSCRDKTSSADEAEDIKKGGRMEVKQLPKQSGRFDLQRLKEEFLFGPKEHSEASLPPPVGAVPVGAAPVGAAPVGAAPVGVASVGATQMGVAWVGATPAGAAPVGAALVGVSSVGSAPIGASPVGATQVRAANVRAVNENTSGDSGVRDYLRREDEELLLDTLRMYITEPKGKPGHPVCQHLNHEELLDKLRKHLSTIETVKSEERHRIPQEPTSRVHFEGDHVQKMLLETLRRHFGRSTNRDKVITDLLTDRKLMENLFFALRRARGFQPVRRTAGSSNFQTKWRDPWKLHGGGPDDDGNESAGSNSVGHNARDLSLSVPVIEIESESENKTASFGTQTEPISPTMMLLIVEEIKKINIRVKESELAEQQEQQQQQNQQKELLQKPHTLPRRSSITDNDDISPSVSDTIKRYLRMARKKSIDSDKVDRFKRVNYDRNLRNIKPKGETTLIGDDDGLCKGIQTDETWITAMKQLKLDSKAIADDESSRVTSSRSSIDTDTLSPPLSPMSPPKPGILQSGQTFLSNLLHHQKNKAQIQTSDGGVSAPGSAMQKSKSSSSVVHHGSKLVAKKIWKTRSKSQTRATPSATCTWTPQGRCVWTSVTGRAITLSDTSLFHVTDIERRVLQKVALAKLQTLNLGVAIRCPPESVGSSSVQKPKRRAYLLKRKAITTGFFDTSRGKDDKDKGETGTTTGLVFGIPLSQCVETERLARTGTVSQGGEVTSPSEETELRRKSHHGSRTSFSSLIETNRTEESGSSDSLISPTLSMPGLDTLSCSSALDLSTEQGGIPNIVTLCLRHLENYGLHTLGIFRVSSSKKRVRQLREEFDCGKEISMDEELCPHDVATLLKEYLRDLPDALLCKDLYQGFIQTQRIRNRRLQHEALTHLIQLLPVPNRDTLYALLSFLAQVAHNADDHKDSNSGEWVLGNKMDSNNLATLFAPNILHSCPKNGAASKEELSAERVEERSDAINVVRCLIDNYKTLFQVPAELLDEVYVHMMDSHPEALDQLLQRREMATEDMPDEQETSIVSEETGERLHLPIDSQESLLSSLSTSDGSEHRRVWSREALSHGTAGMGGPDVEMRPRKERERGRERVSKKRWRDETGGRRRLDSEQSGGSTTPSRRTSYQQDEDRARMSSSETSGRHTPDDFSQMFGERAMDVGVITASLKIPVPAVASFALNLDDTDIPFIEDSERHHMSLGMVRSSSSSHRMSGSDSSQMSTFIHQLTQQHQSIGAQHGYDSAVGSSGGISSPPRNTPSVSSYSSGGVFSSPPSWASTPPTSPDSAIVPVNYIPEEPTTARITIPTKKSTELQQRPVILQRVTIKSTGEVQQVKSSYVTMESSSRIESSASQERRKSKDSGGGGGYQKLSAPSSDKLPKSASSSTVPQERTIPIVREDENQNRTHQSVTTSISSIGGAVLRSKTADIERMLRLQSSSSTTKPSKKSLSEEEKKNKRKYTESRHPTKFLPQPGDTTEAEQSSSQSVTEQRRTGVWKRREIISSEPKERKSFM